MNHQEDEIEVTLASPWERMGAVLINGVFNILAMIPVVVGFVLEAIRNDNYQKLVELSSEEQIQLMLKWLFSSSTWLGWCVVIAYTIWQCVLMSLYGQSLGKKMLRLKVIKQDGSPAGFVGVVLLREVVYTIVVSLVFGIAATILGALLNWGETIDGLFGQLPTIICVLMLFWAPDRRSLQDWMANTVVVKLPRHSRS